MDATEHATRSIQSANGKSWLETYPIIAASYIRHGRALMVIQEENDHYCVLSFPSESYRSRSGDMYSTLEQAMAVYMAGLVRDGGHAQV